MKRIVSLFLVLSMLALTVGILPITAETITPTADWKTNNYVEDGDYYKIATKEDLVAFMKSVVAGQTYAGKTVKLTADIVVNEGDASQWNASTTGLYNWTDCINTVYFEGTFDGNGKSISGLYCANGGNGVGLFGKASNATICNLTIKNSFISGARFLGAVVGIVQAGMTTITNCHLETSRLVCTGQNANSGGLVGVVNSDAGKKGGLTVTECSVSDSAMSVGSFWGGIAGQLNTVADGSKQNTITDCEVTGITVNGTSNIGGLVGINQTALLCKNNTLADTTVSGGANAGGLVGNNSGTLSFENNTLNCAVQSTANAVGGLLGNNTAANLTSKNNTLDVAVKGVANVGGLVGVTTTLVSNNDTVKATVNASDVQVSAFLGYSTGTVTITDASVTGSIAAEGKKSIGGLIGKSTGKLTVNGVTVEDLTINHKHAKPATGYDDDFGVGGLIGNQDTATVSVQNVTIKGLSVIGDAYGVGVLFGLNPRSEVGTTISNVTAVDVTLKTNNGADHMGGIIGFAHSNATINNVFLSETLTGADTVGGLVGGFEAGKTLTATNATVRGDLVATSQASGVSGSGGELTLTDVMVNLSVNATAVAPVGTVTDSSAHVAVAAELNGKEVVMYGENGAPEACDTVTLKASAPETWNKLTANSLPVPASAEALALYREWLIGCKPADMITSEKVSLRLPANGNYKTSGIRFGTRINKDYYDVMVEEGFEMTCGTLILPADMLGEGALTAGTDRVTNIVNSGWFNDTEGNRTAVISYLWYGSLVNVKDANTERDFAGVGYWQIGENVIYTEVETASVAKLAEQVLANPDGYTAKQLEVLRRYAGEETNADA